MTQTNTKPANKNTMEINSKYLEQTPGVIGGALRFKGTRLPVDLVFDHIKAGWSWREIETLFPDLRKAIDKKN